MQPFLRNKHHIAYGDSTQLQTVVTVWMFRGHTVVKVTRLCVRSSYLSSEFVMKFLHVTPCEADELHWAAAEDGSHTRAVCLEHSVLTNNITHSHALYKASNLHLQAVNDLKLVYIPDHPEYS